MKEREFQAWVIEVAELHGWKVWHVGAPFRFIGGGKFVPEPRGRGIPDLIMLREDPPQVIFAEVKKEGGRPSVEQQEFLRLVRGIHDATRYAHMDANIFPPMVQGFLWTPANRDLIEAVLSAR